MTPTPTLIRALRILARDIHSDDGVANEAISEAALRLEELDDHLTAANRELEQANRVSAAASKRILELEADVEATVWKYTPAMADAKIDQLNAKIRELQHHLSHPEPSCPVHLPTETSTPTP
jgi:chromosome segregation ATPase